MENNEYYVPKILRVYLELAQYPILSKAIRQRMREEIFSRGVIKPESFENEVYEKAIESQEREGLANPYSEEEAPKWNERIGVIRDQLTDSYFAYNLPHDLFEEIIQEAVSNRAPGQEAELTFNPEVAPWEVLFAEGERYENLPSQERAKIEDHLQEIKAVLVKAMISTDRRLITLAREAFTMADLAFIRDRRIGRGKIGGKSTGLMLAWKLLQMELAEQNVDVSVFTIPDSYFIASDVFYEFKVMNNLLGFTKQKYRSKEEILAEHALIYERHMQAQLPGYVVNRLHELLEQWGNTPMIFRSSSLLEDSFETAFAGKYESIFLPNQGTLEENLAAAQNAIRQIYASTLSPDVLMYRKQMGHVDFDERMAILIQKVEGRHFGQYFFPVMAGVGFSRNPFRWNPKIRREDGLLRLVCGLGTHAVDRVAQDYPRMVALSHPQLRPERSVGELRRYSQHFIDVLDLKDNSFKTLPIMRVLDPSFPAMRLMASQDEGDYLQPFATISLLAEPKRLVFTFDQLLQGTQFPKVMRYLLASLQKRYQRPVDIEYTVDVTETWPEAKFRITLLQCRPLSQHEVFSTQRIPRDISDADRLFTAHRQIPEGLVERIRYIVYVKPAYMNIDTNERRLEVARVIGRVNEHLEGERFILMGPGRWGSSDIFLGVKATYADLYNTRALIEIAIPNQSGGTPEMAYGTHFFQDLVESKIFPLALYPYDPPSYFNWDFFDTAPNLLPDLLPRDAGFQDIITVIDVSALTDGKQLEIIMSTDEDEALGYLRNY